MTQVRALTAVVLAGAMAACSSSGGGGDTVTIGFTGPLSGGAALYGRNVLDGLEMAIADINENGGFTVNGQYGVLTINVGSGVSYSVRDVALALGRVLGKTIAPEMTSDVVRTLACGSDSISVTET